MSTSINEDGLVAAVDGIIGEIIHRQKKVLANGHVQSQVGALPKASDSPPRVVC